MSSPSYNNNLSKYSIFSETFSTPGRILCLQTCFRTFLSFVEVFLLLYSRNVLLNLAHIVLFGFSFTVVVVIICVIILLVVIFLFFILCIVLCVHSDTEEWPMAKYLEFKFINQSDNQTL